MVAFLFFLSSALISVIVYLNFRFYRDRKRYKKRIAALEAVIVRITQEQHVKEAQVRLSDELRAKLKSINTTLNNDIFDFNHELLEILSQNKLL